MLKLREDRFDPVDAAWRYRSSPQDDGAHRTAGPPLSMSGISPHAEIETEDGMIAAKDIKIGQRVMTLENGLQPVLWAGRGRQTPDGWGKDVVRIRQGALGGDASARQLFLAPGHLVLVRHNLNDLLFGAGDVLCRAQDLAHLDGVDITSRESVNWCHFLFSTHEIIKAEDFWVETLCPDMRVIQASDRDAAQDILQAVPNLVFEAALASYANSHLTLNASESGLLAFS